MCIELTKVLDNDNFYPTPKEVALKMFEKVKGSFNCRRKEYPFILEPSVGKGDLIKHIIDFSNINNCDIEDFIKEKVSVIESDSTLVKILKSENFNLISDDFLTLETQQKFDLIFMNPPFDKGADHLLKAISLQEVYGGKIVCLLNAETLRNPCYNNRKFLKEKLEVLNAEIEFITNGFSTAERKTNVEIALVYIDIPEVYESSILNNLKNSIEAKEDEYISDEIETLDFFKARITRFNRDAEVGINTLRELKKVNSILPQKNRYNSNFIPLEDKLTENGFLQELRLHYWSELLKEPKFIGKLTNNLQSKYYSMINELKTKDFSLFNIMQIQEDMMLNLVQGIEDTILNLFDDFSYQSTYHPEFSKNIHYYNGWKTNKAHYINKKVIQRLNIYKYSHLDLYEAKSKLKDIEKILKYLSTSLPDKIFNIDTILDEAYKTKVISNLEFTFFHCTFYKKGTVHITFKDQKLLDRFNIYASQKKGWLPPRYGKSSYKDLTPEEKDVVDTFQGKSKYETVFNNQSQFIINSSSLLQIE